MIKYRCKHKVEAMRWDGMSREVVTAWHEQKTQKTPWFRENHTVMIMMGDEWHEVKPTEWILWSDGEFLVMDHEVFVETYEAVS